MKKARRAVTIFLFSFVSIFGRIIIKTFETIPANINAVKGLSNRFRKISLKKLNFKFKLKSKPLIAKLVKISSINKKFLYKSADIIIIAKKTDIKTAGKNNKAKLSFLVNGL